MERNEDSRIHALDGAPSLDPLCALVSRANTQCARGGLIRWIKACLIYELRIWWEGPDNPPFPPERHWLSYRVVNSKHTEMRWCMCSSDLWCDYRQPQWKLLCLMKANLMYYIMPDSPHLVTNYGCSFSDTRGHLMMWLVGACLVTNFLHFDCTFTKYCLSQVNIGGCRFGFLCSPFLLFLIISLSFPVSFSPFVSEDRLSKSCNFKGKSVKKSMKHLTAQWKCVH